MVKLLMRKTPFLGSFKFKRVASNFRRCNIESSPFTSDLGIIRITVTANPRITTFSYHSNTCTTAYTLLTTDIHFSFNCPPNRVVSDSPNARPYTLPLAASHSWQLLVDNIVERPVLRWTSRFNSAVFTCAADTESSSHDSNSQGGVNINKATSFDTIGSAFVNDLSASQPPYLPRPHFYLPCS